MQNRFIFTNDHTCRVFFLLLVLIGLIYSNSYQAIWTLDDIQNILQNKQVQIEDLLPETLYKTFFSPQHPDQHGNPGLNRPIPHLSFALNWFLGKDSPVGYRLVNILIHFVTAFVLFLVVRDLLDSPVLKGKYANGESFIALLSAVLWAVNPIQTQAVVYIVQRMAALACLFYLLSIWCYIQARRSEQPRTRIIFILLTLTSFLAGVFSKENALLLPASLVLVEFTFFQDLSQPKARKLFRYVMASSIGLLLVCGVLLFVDGKLSQIVAYNDRLFTVWERLLTQPRVVLFYISQIFYPVPTRLSIVHDVVLSRSLIDPWTTLPAIIGVMVLVGIGFSQMRKRPMLSFGLLFFFLNHLVESSIIGLELIFEHRNYLPSLFLFTPVAVGLRWLIDCYRAQNSGFQYVIISFIILLVTGFGAGTYIRNMAWSDAKTFWEDAADKAPFSSRPLHNLAFEHYQKTGQHEKALELYYKALRLNDYNRKSLSVVHNNIAVHYLREGNPRKAIENLKKAQAGYPEIETFQYLHALALFQTQDYHKALHILDTLLSDRPSVFNHLLLKAKILLHLDRVEEALAQLRRCVKLAPDSAETLSLIGVALNMQGHFKRAEMFLRRVLHRYPTDKTTLLRMAHCRIQANDKAMATAYISKFLNQVPVGQIESAFEKALDDPLFSLDFKERLYRLVLQQATEQTTGMLEAHRVEDSLISELRSHD